MILPKWDLPQQEVRDILASALKPQIRMGDALAALGRKVGLTDEDVAVFDSIRDKAPTKPLKF